MRWRENVSGKTSWLCGGAKLKKCHNVAVARTLKKWCAASTAYMENIELVFLTFYYIFNVLNYVRKKYLEKYKIDANLKHLCLYL